MQSRKIIRSLLKAYPMFLRISKYEYMPFWHKQLSLMLSELNKDRVDSQKPRKEGLTGIVDRFQVLDKENFEALSGYIDIVKIHLLHRGT